MNRIAKTSVIIILFSVFIYLTGITLFFVFNINREQKDILQNLDFKLSSSNDALTTILKTSNYSEYIDNYREGLNYKDFVVFLTDIADKCEFKFIYIVRKNGEKFEFVASSATADELATGTFVTKGDTYEDAPAILEIIYETGNSAYFEYRDRWGSYRSYGSSFELNGEQFILVIDKEIDFVTSVVRESILRAVLTGLFFVSLILPFIFFQFSLTKKEIRNLKRELYIDPLTGLSNRNHLIIDISKTFDCTLFIINIDGFKEINNYFGYDFGDKVLKEMVNRLLFILVSDEYKLYKLQADEFAILFNKNASLDEVSVLARYFVEALTENPISIHDSEIYFNVTCGAANKKNHSKIKDELLLNADIALKMARESGNKFFVYTENKSPYKTFERNIKCAKELKEAIRYDRVITFYQAIKNIKSDKIEKFESLVRVIDSKGATLPPAEFLEVAKNTHMYFILTRIMINNAFRDFKDKPYQFSINLSIKDILDQEMAIFIINKLSENPETSKRLIFEILESEGIENYSEVVDFIGKIKEMGVEIAIDDFGSGYSNFDHILKLKVDYIKIDGSLIKNIDTNINSHIITKQIVTLAHQLGIRTVAEFVHSDKVYNIVKETGCDFSQGYFIAEPSKVLP